MLVLSADLLEGGSDRHDVVLLSNLGCVVGAGTCSCPPRRRRWCALIVGHAPLWRGVLALGCERRYM